MNREEFIDVQQNLILFAYLVSQLDLTGFVRAIDEQPDINNSGNIANLKRLALAAQIVQRESAPPVSEQRHE